MSGGDADAATGELHVGLRDLVNVQLAEGTFHRIVAALNAHTTQLQALREELRTKVSAEQFHREVDGLHGRLHGVEQRVDAIERGLIIPCTTNGGSSGAAAVPGASAAGADGGNGGGDGRGGTVGEHLGACMNTLGRVVRDLQTRATHTQLQEQEESLQRCLAGEVKALKLWGMDRQAGEDLWQSYHSLQQTVAAQQASLATKLDRTEIQHVSHLLGRVSAVASFMDESKSRITALEGAVTRAREAHSRLAADAHTTQQCTEAMETALGTKATITAVAQLDERLADMQRAMAAAATKCHGSAAAAEARQEQLRHDVAALGESVRRGQSAGDGRREALREAVEAQLSTKADVKVCDALWEELRSEINCKAWGEELKGLAERVDGLTAEQAATAKQAALAVRFVDWFSTRGEAYDHNLNAVENQLHSMATGALAAINGRQPYSGTLRFTPADA